MSDVTINYRGSSIATMNASGTKTLLTAGKYCDDDIEVVYVSPGGGGYTAAEFLAGIAPSGDIVENSITTLYGQLGRNTAITSFKSNSITSIGVSDAFHGCTSLLSAEFTAIITNINNYVFQGCSNLQTAKFPYLTGNIMIYAFDGCSSLTLVDGGQTPTIISNAFKNCSALNVIIIRRANITSLQNINAFDGTPFANGGTGGEIYIPEALYNHLGDNSSSDYKAASNWSTLNAYNTITWKKIEGSIYEL